MPQPLLCVTNTSFGLETSLGRASRAMENLAITQAPSPQHNKCCHYISLYSGLNQISDFNLDLSCFLAQ